MITAPVRHRRFRDFLLVHVVTSTNWPTRIAPGRTVTRFMPNMGPSSGLLRKLASVASVLAARASPVRATHQALADELGSVREIVSRLLRGFEEQGLVRLGREQVEVLQRERLARMATAE